MKHIVITKQIKSFDLLLNTLPKIRGDLLVARIVCKAYIIDIFADENWDRRASESAKHWLAVILHDSSRQAGVLVVRCLRCATIFLQQSIKAACRYVRMFQHGCSVVQNKRKTCSTWNERLDKQDFSSDFSLIKKSSYSIAIIHIGS